MAIEDFEGVDFGDYTPSDRVTEFGGVSELAKGYDEALSKIQSKGILVPGEDASDDDKSAFNTTLREHLGLIPPESADGYSWKPPEGMEEKFKGYEDQLKKYHEAGYDDNTVSFMMNEQVESIGAIATQLQEAQKQMAEESEAALKEKWGDNYEENIKAANAMEGRFPGLFEKLKATGLANDQSVLEAMHEISLSVREDAPPVNDPTTIKSLQEELKTLKADPSYMRGNDPNHSKTMDRIRDINKQLAKT
jgi:hypothetical protein